MSRSEPCAAGGSATVTAIRIAPPTSSSPATRVASALPPIVGRGGSPRASLRRSQFRGPDARLELPFSMRANRKGRSGIPCKGKPADFPEHLMAETLPKEGISARLAEIRGQLKLLSDYL